MKKLQIALIAFPGAVCLILLLLLGLRSCESPEAGAERLEKQRAQAAYERAASDIPSEVPGFVAVSPFEDSKVAHKGARYTVTLHVDRRNDSGGTVRERMQVLLERSGDEWRIVEVKKNMEGTLPPVFPNLD